MGTATRTASDDDHGEPSIRVGGLAAMRAVAHPTRVRIMQLLRSEELSASELARRLGIRFGSAQYHLRTLERAGIAHRVQERSRRGGREVLFAVPRGLGVDVDAEAPAAVRHAMNRAWVEELVRRLDAAAEDQRPDDTDRDVLTTREVELRPADLPAAARALSAFLDRLDELSLDRPTDDSLPFTASVQFFRLPRSASRWPEGDDAR